MRTRFRYAFFLRTLCAAALALPLSASALWIDVPFVSQPPQGCGSASISMIMRYWSRQDGRRVPPEAEVSAIQAALYSRKDRGISNTAMRRYLGTNGFRTFAYRGDWNDLAHEIALGRPLIIAMAPERAGASLHYVVVVGVDRDANFVFVNDPAQGKLLRISREVFESQWKAVDNWTLLALPPPSK